MGEMTRGVPGAKGFVAPAQRAVIAGMGVSPDRGRGLAYVFGAADHDRLADTSNWASTDSSPLAGSRSVTVVPVTVVPVAEVPRGQHGVGRDSSASYFCSKYFLAVATFM